MRGSAVFRTGIAPGGALAGPWVRNPLWTRARAVPSLDLRFADNKSLVDAVTGASLITFTRASSATFVDSAGVLQTAATDVPRFDHNPTTGESLGLLVEEPRTNLLLRSEEFGTTWTTFRASVSANATAAPDGNTTADKIVEDTTAASTHGVQQLSLSFTSGTSYTFSVYVKAAERANIRMGLPSAAFTSTLSAQFNLALATTTFVSAGVTTTVSTLPNGWLRCAMTAVATATTTGAVNFSLGENSASTSAGYTGDGTSGLFAWGAQLEAGAFPTSYIATTGAAATRSADVASITGTAFSSFYNQSEGTVFVDGSTAALTGTTGFVAINAAGSTNRLEIRQSRNTPNTTGATTDVIWTNIVVSPTIVINTSYKQAVAFSNASHGNSIAGSLDTSSTTIGTIAATQLFFGIRASQTAPTGGSSSTIRRLAFWTQRLPNSTLPALTQ